MKLPLDTIKQMFNLPQNASMNDVVKFANDNNIEIDFFNTSNNTKTQQNLNNPSGSIYGESSPKPAAPKPAAKPSAPATTNKTNINIDLTGTQPTSSSGPVSNNNSVFGFGNTTQPEDDFLGFKRTINPTVSQNLTVSGQVKEQKKPDLALNTSVSTRSAGALDDFLSSALTSTNQRFANFAKMNLNSGNEKVVKITFTPDGKKQKLFEDGSTKIEDLTPQELQLRSNGNNERKITSIEYLDGNVIVTDANGETKTRKACFGETGYKKDGNSIDEDLVSVLGEKKIQSLRETEAQAKAKIADIDAQLEECSDEKIAELMETNPNQANKLKKQQKKLKNEKAKLEKKIYEEKKALASDYIKKIYKECNGDKEKIKAKIHSLVRNSDMNSETSQQMAQILGRFHEKYGNLSEDEMAKVLAEVMDPSRGNSAENTEALAGTITHERGETGRRMRGAYTQAARRTGQEKVAGQALARNVGHAVDPDTGEVDTETAQDIVRKASDLGGKDAVLIAGDQAIETGNDDLSVAVSKPIDEYAIKTGDEEVMQKSIDVITSIEDADKQVKANEQSHQTYEEMGASDEIKQKRAELVGKNLYKFNENARSQIDDYERKNDINNAYSNAAQEAKNKYESEHRTNRTEESQNITSTSDSESTSSEGYVSAVAESERRISSIVNNTSINTTQKAKQLKFLTPKEQLTALKQIINTSTIPEIKSLALSGLKTEVLNYLFNNYSPENSSMLESLSDIMNSAEKNHFEELKKQHSNQQPPMNFFLNN